jgi:hypothetical protein
MAHAGVRSRDHRPSFGQLLGGRKYARTASMQAHTNVYLPQRKAKLKGRHFAVTIKCDTCVFFKSNEKVFP